MFIIALGVISNILLFAIVGFLPTFFLVGSEKRLLNTIALAPVAGFAITSLLATYLILLDFPVNTWYAFYIIFWIVLDAGVFLYFIVRKNLNSVRPISIDKNIYWLLGGISLTIIIAALPMFLGGLQFTALRGNATDTFNYVSMAQYLDREPYSWKNKASLNDLIEKDTTYPLAKGLLAGRWTTSAILAYTSHISNVPPYEFEYAYTLLFFIMSFGPGYLIGRKLNLNPLLSCSVALVVCTGFWAQFVLDIRAFSEINSIPLILSIAYLILHIVDDEKSRLFWKPILLGVFGASLVFSYTEIVPFCVLGILIFLIFLIANKKLDRRLLISVGMILILILLFSLPLYSLLKLYLENQLSSATQGSQDWSASFFTWLYGHHIIGFWGLIPFTFIKKLISVPALNFIFSSTLSAVGGVLYCITLIAILRTIIRKNSNTAILLIVSFVLSFLTGFLYLYIKSQLWAAGKALAYGYPFFIFLVAGAAFEKNFSFLPSIFNKGLKFCVLVWLVLQLALGLARNIVAVTGEEYIDYVYNHGEYKKHDYDLSPFKNVLKNEPKSIIWTSLSNIWMGEYLNFAFNGDQRLINTFSATNHYYQPLGSQKLDGPPRYILADRNFLLFNKEWTPYIVAENSDFILLKADRADFSFFAISNPNGIETWNGEVGLWLSKDKTKITFISSKDSQVEFTADFYLGPSIPEKETQNFRIILNDEQASYLSTVVTNKEKKSFIFPVKRGRNVIAIEAVNVPTLAQLPNGGDNRIMLMGVSAPKINFLNP